MEEANGTELMKLPPPNLMPPPPEIVNQLTLLDAIIVTAVTNFVALVGSVGNVLNIIILREHGFDNSTNIILLSLAVADLLYLMTSPVRNVSNYIRVFNKGLAVTVDTFVFSYAMIFNSIFSVTSMTHIVIIAFERLLAVYVPFKVSRWVTPRRMTIVAVCAHALWYPVWIPLLFRMKIQWMFDPSLNQTVAIPAYSDFYIRNIGAIETFYNYYLMIFTGPFYSFIVLCCCIATTVKLILVSRKREVLTKGQTKQDSIRRGINIKIVRMLILVCMVYFISTLPPSLFMVLQVTGATVTIDEVKSYSTVLLWCLNSSANFVIYVIMSAKFKATFKTMLGCKKAA